MGKAPEGILAIASLESHIPVSYLFKVPGNATNRIQADKSPDLHAHVHDAKWIALYYRSMIEEAPLQTSTVLGAWLELSGLGPEAKLSFPQVICSARLVLKVGISKLSAERFQAESDQAN